MIKHAIAVLLVGFVALSGCSTTTASNNPQNRTTMVTTGDLAQLNRTSNTFAWHPTLAVVETHDKIDDHVVIGHMRQAIAKVLSAKGYRLATQQETPSMLVGFGLALESKMSDNEILNKVGIVAGLSSVSMNDEYEKGSVLVAFFAPEQRLPAWRVLAQGYAENDKAVAERELPFEHFIASMLKGVPAI
ncbi:DUF4136 domain-containing protein [Shewanella youngdeokensis]|uniref:DUF4136 domain-containing protein n=1 Tax=Shewanella youngdeokensis TaxID=2999068 RepID=A0ABZ0JX23_9GAMM|nr:DUF4136 domain-containing protein [Shewanella sp. DAU334]